MDIKKTLEKQNFQVETVVGCLALVASAKEILTIAESGINLDVKIKHEAADTPVTNADIRSSQVIRKIILTEFPTHTL